FARRTSSPERTGAVSQTRSMKRYSLSHSLKSFIEATPFAELVYYYKPFSLVYNNRPSLSIRLCSFFLYVIIGHTQSIVNQRKGEAKSMTPAEAGKILGISPKADIEQVKKQYRRLL